MKPMLKRGMAAALAVLAIFVTCLLPACSDGSSPSVSNSTSSTSASSSDDGTSSADDGVSTGSKKSAAKKSSKSTKSKKATGSSSSSSSLSSDYTAHAWSYSKYPLYYKVWGKAKVSGGVDKGETKTSPLDSLGRTQAVASKVTYSMVAKSAGWREDMSAECDEISGWGHQEKVSVELSNGRSYNGYAWNRSHLLADSLGGHAVRKNMVTGTRTQNVGNNNQSQPGGMQYTETAAVDYLNSHHSGWVYYKATPVYKGSELVCRSVYVDIKTDDGSINEHVEVFNAMNGCKIDYKTGTISGSAVKEGSSSSSSRSSGYSYSSSTKSSSGRSSSSSSAKGYVYITKTGKKYHRSGCQWLKWSKIKIKKSEAEDRGYTACGTCF